MTLYNKDYTLENKEQIEEYFKDSGYNLFYDADPYDYETERTTILKIKDKYYRITIEVTMIGERQDVGEKIYHIDSIDSVTYKEVEYEELVINFNNFILNSISIKENEICTLRKELI